MAEITPAPAPSTDWELIPLAEQFANHDEFRPPATDELAGVRARLHFTGGVSADVDLVEAERLRWSATGPLLWGTAGEAPYEAVPIRDGVYAITVPRLEDHTSALVVLDRSRARALVNLTTFVERDGGRREVTTAFQAGIDRALETPFPPTTELVGKRVAHRYSTTHVFEHIYLNPNTYAFQGLTGPEAGVTDVDRADYWKLGEQLYLLSWHERSQPFNGAVVIDLARSRATGRLVGFDPASGRTLQVRTGAQVTLLSVTTYDNI